MDELEAQYDRDLSRPTTARSGFSPENAIIWAG